MRKKPDKETARKGRMGFVTNRMSDEVYNQLNSKAQKNQLSKYINELVEKDLNNRSAVEHNQNMNGKINELEQKIDNLEQLLIRIIEKAESREQRTMELLNGQYEIIYDQWELFNEQIDKTLQLFSRHSLLYVASALSWIESLYSVTPNSNQLRTSTNSI